MSIQRVHENIDAHRGDDLERLIALCRQPSVASRADGGVQGCCELLCETMRELGVTPVVYPTRGSPIVYGEARSPRPEAKTLLIYGHYDVQPPEPLEAWDTPPFEPTLKDGRLYGRGTADNKGQFLCHLLALRSFMESGEALPVHLKFIFDGEEEISSPYIFDFIGPNSEMLAADLCFYADGAIHASNRPIVAFGCRGILKLQFELTTSVYDNHSGNKGNQIPNAAWEMVRFLAALIDSNGRSLVPGFYDEVQPPSDYDLALIDRLEYDPQQYARIYGVNEITLSKREFYERLMFVPTFTLNGVHSGYGGKGTKTVIPGSAMAKMDIRLVDAQEPRVVFEKIRAYAQTLNPDVKVSYLGGVLPSSTQTDLPICRAVAEAVAHCTGLEPLILPRIGATCSEYYWTKHLGIPTVSVPYGNPDENNHAPNENMDLALFYRGSHISAEIFRAVGELV